MHCQPGKPIHHTKKDYCKECEYAPMLRTIIQILFNSAGRIRKVLLWHHSLEGIRTPPQLPHKAMSPDTSIISRGVSLVRYSFRTLGWQSVFGTFCQRKCPSMCKVLQIRILTRTTQRILVGLTYIVEYCCGVLCSCFETPHRARAVARLFTNSPSLPTDLARITRWVVFFGNLTVCI